MKQRPLILRASMLYIRLFSLIWPCIVISVLAGCFRVFSYHFKRFTIEKVNFIYICYQNVGAYLIDFPAFFCVFKGGVRRWYKKAFGINKLALATLALCVCVCVFLCFSFFKNLWQGWQGYFVFMCKFCCLSLYSNKNLSILAIELSAQNHIWNSQKS